MVELAYVQGIETLFSELRDLRQNLFISVGVALNQNASDIALELAETDVDTIHFYADDHGRETETVSARFLIDTIRGIHLALVEQSLRQRINLLFSGGIAMAEHVAKSIICGADGVVIDTPLLIAMECRMCFRCKDGFTCPAKLEEVDAHYGSRRITNLMGAWRNQLLEMMGAMGLREARRLRGEVGRSMAFADLEKECFGPLFGERKVA
jgi:glutamate synthase domain-containing protein 2